MNQSRFELFTRQEYRYPLGLGFLPTLHAYVHPEPEVRPAVLVVPGGAYLIVSVTEAEIVAKKFYDMGYQAFVLTYTTNPLQQAPLRDQALRDLARGVRFVRAGAEKLRVLPDKVAVCGFSAGGHLCASLVTHWQDVKEENPLYAPHSCRPDCAILSYPVISCGKYGHRDSSRALMGDAPTLTEAEYWSLETQVTRNACPCFVWHTATDQAVCVENSILFTDALRRAGVPYALHVFSRGDHGLSTADEDWARCRFGGAYYVVEQHARILEAIDAGALRGDPELVRFMRERQVPYPEDVTIPGRIPNPEAAAWPHLADEWMRSLGLS